MEAMAAGMKIVTSDLGALPETTLGYGELISPDGDFIARYREALIRAIDEYSPAAMYEQVKHVTASCTWKERAGELTTFLKANNR
jgi:hypothetical protein